MNKAKAYENAVYDFFGNMPSVAWIEGVNFQKATKNRIYFNVRRVAFSMYGYDDANVSVFVRKKDLTVEVYHKEIGIITNEYCKSCQQDQDEFWEEIFEWEEEEREAERKKLISKIYKDKLMRKLSRNRQYRRQMQRMQLIQHRLSK